MIFNRPLRSMSNNSFLCFSMFYVMSFRYRHNALGRLAVPPSLLLTNYSIFGFWWKMINYILNVNIRIEIQIFSLH